MRRKSEFALLICAFACLITTGTVLAFLRSEAATKVSHRTLTLAERVAYQRAIEEVYWRHRIWPKENRDPKPSLDAVMSEAQLGKKVMDYLRNSQALEDYYHHSVTAEDLQTEMDRMAENTKQPEVLRELFDALENDPFVIAECLVRPVLSERLITSFAQEQRDGRSALWKVATNIQTRKVILANATYTLPTISDATTGCTPDTWTNTNPTAPEQRRDHTAVWTGSEMIVWGGFHNGCLNTGGRYDPSTDNWMATSTINAPDLRDLHTAVWTGSEMIAWGGYDGVSDLNTGGRYNPATNSWTTTSIINAPTARELHTAVWTGSEMIVWGGLSGFTEFDTGGKYDPLTDSWTATSTRNAPLHRDSHTAVWTANRMIIWGGFDLSGLLNTGGVYDPLTDNWTDTSTASAPDGRWFHRAVWTGSEMIVWGGCDDIDCRNYLNTGGRYNPSTDTWTATSTTNAPDARYFHTAVWTDTEVIVWGGYNGSFNGSFLDTGGRYNPTTDRWIATNTFNAPEGRQEHTAVWTGNEMIVWGGRGGPGVTLTGGRYCARHTPTSQPRPTPAPRP